MPQFQYRLYDVFTSTPFTGNPLAVFLDAKGISDGWMAKIANELNLSESVFITPNEESGGVRLRIFTPQTELPFAGHPTIGAACAIRDSGMASGQISMSLKAGDFDVTLEGESASFLAPLKSQPVETMASNADVAELLGLDEKDIVSLRGGSGGVPFALIELASRDALSRCELSLASWRQTWADSSTPHIYVFCLDQVDRVIDARMFAPAMGIAEDPATGGAAAAIAAILPDGDYEVIQGEDMGRRSLIRLGVRSGRAKIGGEAVMVGQGEILIPG